MTKIISTPGCWTADLLLAALQSVQTEPERGEILRLLDAHFGVCGCGAVINGDSPVVPQDGLQRELK